MSKRSQRGMEARAERFGEHRRVGERKRDKREQRTTDDIAVLRRIAGDYAVMTARHYTKMYVYIGSSVLMVKRRVPNVSEWSFYKDETVYERRLNIQRNGRIANFKSICEELRSVIETQELLISLE